MNTSKTSILKEMIDWKMEYSKICLQTNETIKNPRGIEQTDKRDRQRKKLDILRI